MNPYTINLVLLVISSLNRLSVQIREGAEDKKTLKNKLKLLERYLLTTFVANFENEDVGMAILTEYCLDSVLPKLGITLSEGDRYPITATIQAEPRRRDDGILGLSATEISMEHILAMYRHGRPEIARA